jgi:hypothetical protein
MHKRKHTPDRTPADEREIMKSPHGRGQNTAGDREIMAPSRAKEQGGTS